MQITSGQKKRVAIFFIFGVALFVTITAILVGNKVLKRESCYYTKFQNLSVSGLSEGSSVKFQGMNIGQVRDISIDKKDTTVIKVDICIKPGIPIKVGTIANLGNIGITGLKFIELKGGGSGADIPVNGEIPGKKSEWDKISGQAGVITNKIEQIANQVHVLLKQIDPKEIPKLLKHIENITKSLENIAKSAEIIIKKSEKDIPEIISNSAKIVKKFDKSMKDINYLTKDFKIITKNIKRITGKDGAVEKTLASFTNAADGFEKSGLRESVKQINKLLSSFQKMVNNINLTLLKSQDEITSAFEDLSEGMSNFNEFSRIIMENPAAIIRGDGGGGAK